MNNLAATFLEADFTRLGPRPSIEFDRIWHFLLQEKCWHASSRFADAGAPSVLDRSEGWETNRGGGSDLEAMTSFADFRKWLLREENLHAGPINRASPFRCPATDLQARAGS